MLGLYLKRYLPILSNVGYNQKIRIYDLFCGEGAYENGGEGSPLVILRAIKAVKDSGVVNGPLPPLECQFNDIDTQKMSKTKAVAEAKGSLADNAVVTHFTSNIYQEEIKKLSALFPTLKQGKALVFIDPYGYKHIRASDIKKLLQTRIAEVL